MSVINTNLSALKGQGNLSRTQGQLSTAMERLSSGMRVNGAKDDAAGQAIGNRMTSQINGRGMAQRNANDGISMSQTAQGALDQVNDKLQRIRELTVQGLNGTLQTRDGDTVQTEINQNLMEIDRLAELVGYNGIPLLNGRAGEVGLQVGANDGDKLGLDLRPPGFSVQALGLEDFNVAGVPGSVTPRDTLMGQAVDIVLEDPRTSVSYPTGADKPLYTLGAVDAPGTYYVSMGEGNFSLVDVSATHVTATDESEVIIDNPRALYRTYDALAAKGIDNLEDGQRLIRVDNTYYLEEEEAGRITYREAGFTISFDEQGAPSAVLNPVAERLEGEGSGDYTYAEVGEDETIEVPRGGDTVTFDLADFDDITFQGLTDAQDPALVVGEDLTGTSHYYVRNGSGEDASYYRVNGAESRLQVSSEALAEPPGTAGMTVTEPTAFTFDGDTFTLDDFDETSFTGLSNPVLLEYRDNDDDSTEYFLRTGASGNYTYHDITDVETELQVSSDDQAFAGPDLLTLGQGGEIVLGPDDEGIQSTPTVSNFLQSGVTATFPDDLAVDDPELVQRTSDDAWVIRGTLPDGGYGYYDAELEVELDADGAPVAYTATTQQSEPTELGVDEHIVEKVHGVSTVTIDPRNVKVEYTDREGRVYENVLRESEDGNYYFELPGESSLLGGYKTATLVDYDGENEILLRTENGGSEVVVYYPTELGQLDNSAFFVLTDGDGFNDEGDPVTRLRIQEAGDDFRLQVPRNPLAALDRAIGMVDAKRSHLGAMENRLADTVQANETTGLNLSEARSRIMDADYAVETSAMVKAQILQQAGNSMLAQANVMPENVLALLG